MTSHLSSAALNSTYEVPIDRGNRFGAEFGSNARTDSTHGRTEPDVARDMQQMRSHIAGPLLMQGTTQPGDRTPQYTPNFQWVKTVTDPNVIRSYMIETISSLLTALIQVTFPLRKIDNKAVTVEMLEIAQAFMQNYAEFGVPQTMSFNKTSHTYDTSRQGLGFQMEWNLAQTEQGAKILTLYMQNLGVAFVKNIGDQIINALTRVRSEAPTFPLLEERDAFEMLARRAQFSCIICKQPNGFALVVARVLETLRRRKLRDIEASSLVMVVPDSLLSALRDLSLPYATIMNPDQKGTAALQILGGLSGHLAIAVLPTSVTQGVSHQPLVTKVSHGGYGVLPVTVIKRWKGNRDNYRSSMRNATMQAYTRPGFPKEVEIVEVAEGAWRALVDDTVAYTTARPAAAICALFGISATAADDALTAAGGAAGPASLGAASTGALMKYMKSVLEAKAATLGSWATTLHGKLPAINAAAETAYDAVLAGINKPAVAGAAPLSMKIAAFFRWLNLNDYFDPFSYAVVRPFVSWSKAHAIVLPRNGAAGFTGYQEPNIQSSVDTNQKNIMWHAHMYSGVVLTDPESIVHVPDLVPIEYHDGGALRIVKGGVAPLKVEDGDTYPIVLHQDIDANLMSVDRQPIDITGAFNGRDVETRTPHTPHYHYASRYRVAYGWERPAQNIKRAGGAWSSVAYPDSQYLCSATTEGEINTRGFALVGQGPWGAVLPKSHFTDAILGAGAPKYEGMVTVPNTGEANPPPEFRK